MTDPTTGDGLLGLVRMGRPLFLVGDSAFHGLGLSLKARAGLG